MFRADRGIRRVGLAGYAVAALDIALWDLVGKVAGQPLFRMWGAATDRVEAYGSGGWANYGSKTSSTRRASTPATGAATTR